MQKLTWLLALSLTNNVQVMLWWLLVLVVGVIFIGVFFKFLLCLS